MRFSANVADISVAVGTPRWCNSSGMQVLHNNAWRSRALRSCPDPICLPWWKRGASAARHDSVCVNRTPRSSFFFFCLVRKCRIARLGREPVWPLPKLSGRVHISFVICLSISGLVINIYNPNSMYLLATAEIYQFIWEYYQKFLSINSRNNRISSSEINSFIRLHIFHREFNGVLDGQRLAPLHLAHSGSKPRGYRRNVRSNTKFAVARFKISRTNSERWEWEGKGGGRG